MERIRVRHRVFAAVAAIAIVALRGGAGDAARTDLSTDIEGRWRVEKRDAVVLVERRGGGFAGRVVWAKDRDGIKGDERLDTKNPRPELRSRKVLGLDILTGLAAMPDGNGWHRGGRIYNPKTGKSYPVKVRRDSPDRLRLRVGGSVLGQTTYWTREP